MSLHVQGKHSLNGTIDTVLKMGPPIRLGTFRFGLVWFEYLKFSQVRLTNFNCFLFNTQVRLVLVYLGQFKLEQVQVRINKVLLEKCIDKSLYNNAHWLWLFLLNITKKCFHFITLFEIKGCRAICRLAICRQKCRHNFVQNEKVPTHDLSTSIFDRARSKRRRRFNVVDVLTSLMSF